MRQLLLVVVAAVVAIALYRHYATPPAEAARAQSSDPVTSFAARMEQFPMRVHHHLSETQLSEVVSDVRKTDSLATPIVGLVRFQMGTMPFEIVFHWRDNAWYFERVRCLNPAANPDVWNNVPLESPELKAWIARGRVDSAEVQQALAAEQRAQEAEAAAAQAAAKASAPSTPRRQTAEEAAAIVARAMADPRPTPTRPRSAAEENAEIARKYGTR